MSIYSIKYKGNTNTSSVATMKIFTLSTVVFFAAAYIASIYF